MKKLLTLFILLYMSMTWSYAFRIAMTGDIMMGTTLPEPYLPENNGRYLFQYARETLRSADFAFGNLEGTLCDTDATPRPCNNPRYYYIFKMPQKYVSNLVDAGFDAVNIATNHINDLGKEGRDSTMSTLKAAGLAFTGLKNICETRVLRKSGKDIGICSFCHSANSVRIDDISYATKLVKSLREKCDYVIVTFHAGAEGAAFTHVTRKEEQYVGEKRGNVYEFAHACIDAGADLVFGHGPHVPRALELYKGHLIAYSLGNFCTPYRVNLQGISGYAPLLVAEIDERGLLVRGRIESYIQQRGKGPIRDETEKAASLMKKLSSEDFPESKLVFQGNMIYPE